MKKVYIIPIVLIIIIILFIILKNRKKEVEISNIKYFNFGYSTGYMMNANVSYNIELKDDKYIISIKPDGKSEEETLKKEISTKKIKELEKILKEYEVGKWNGFDKVDKNVLDGNSFSLRVKFANDDTIDASGYMKYPENYSIVRNELDKFFMDIYEKNN